MKARIKKVTEVGSCNYCDKSELRHDGMGLDYPYDEVIEINGRSVTSRLCYECASDIAVLYESF